MNKTQCREAVRQSRKALVACVQAIELLEGTSVQFPVALRLQDAAQQAKRALAVLPEEKA